MNEYKVISKNGDFSCTYNAKDLKDAKRYARFYRVHAMPWVDIKIYKNSELLYDVVEKTLKVEFVKVV